MKWFAVRSVYRHASLGRRAAVYEERVVLYQARGVSQAAARAQKDSKAYLAANPQFAEVSAPAIFVLRINGSDLDGAETWSCLFKGPREAGEFWNARYERFAIGSKGT